MGKSERRGDGQMIVAYTYYLCLNSMRVMMNIVVLVLRMFVLF